MAGIYIHIPFCLSKCGYCDFYSITNIGEIPQYVECLKKELILRKNNIIDNQIDTIYIGGGTPSLLTIEQLTDLLNLIYNNYNINPEVEITLEINPDDCKLEFISLIKKDTKVNRLSLGIQSFEDEYLRLMQRRHNADQAIKAVEMCQNTGFDNISIDLIYCIDNQTIKQWETDLDKAFKLNVQHISAYNLTIEKNTAFYKLLKTKKLKLAAEDTTIEMLKILIQQSREHNFEHYEISNFALANYYSLHNSNYWRQKEYLGIGASAHSYNYSTRSWNISDIKKYCQQINNNKLSTRCEIIDKYKKYNEYIMTSLRTKFGANIDYIKTNFPATFFNDFTKKVHQFEQQKYLFQQNNSIILTDSGIFISNHIIAAFFILE